MCNSEDTDWLLVLTSCRAKIAGSLARLLLCITLCFTLHSNHYNTLKYTVYIYMLLELHSRNTFLGNVCVVC